MARYRHETPGFEHVTAVVAEQPSSRWLGCRALAAAMAQAARLAMGHSSMPRYWPRRAHLHKTRDIRVGNWRFAVLRATPVPGTLPKRRFQICRVSASRLQIDSG